MTVTTFRTALYYLQNLHLGGICCPFQTKIVPIVREYTLGSEQDHSFTPAIFIEGHMAPWGPLEHLKEATDWKHFCDIYKSQSCDLYNSDLAYISFILCLWLGSKNIKNG